MFTLSLTAVGTQVPVKVGSTPVPQELIGKSKRHLWEPFWDSGEAFLLQTILRLIECPHHAHSLMEFKLE